MKTLKQFLQLDMKKPLYKDWVIYLFLFATLSVFSADKAIVSTQTILICICVFLWLPSKLRLILKWALAANNPQAKAAANKKMIEEKQLRANLKKSKEEARQSQQASRREKNLVKRQERVEKKERAALTNPVRKTESNPGFKVGKNSAFHMSYLLNCSHTILAGSFNDRPLRVGARVYCTVCKEERIVTRRIGTGQPRHF